MTLLASFALVAGTGCAQGSGAMSADERYWSSCPDTPAWNRNLDGFPDYFPDKVGYPTPEAAVRAAAGAGVEIANVAVGRARATIDVHLDGDDGEFLAERLDLGWVLYQGEGCAAWPAGEELLKDGDCVPAQSATRCRLSPPPPSGDPSP